MYKCLYFQKIVYHFLFGIISQVLCALHVLWYRYFAKEFLFCELYIISLRCIIFSIWLMINFYFHSTLFSEISPVQHDDDRGELSEADQPPVIQFLASIWFAILSHSSLFCYFMVFLHQIKNASVLSIPLPLMVFFWGSLTIPRPSKTFWVTLIAYTEVKYYFSW